MYIEAAFLQAFEVDDIMLVWMKLFNPVFVWEPVTPLNIYTGISAVSSACVGGSTQRKRKENCNSSDQLSSQSEAARNCTYLECVEKHYAECFVKKCNFAARKIKYSCIGKRIELK